MRTLKVTVFLLLSIFTTVISAQTLNPDQTVNPSTGTMGFSLPLGTVKGAGGLNFPVTMNYQSGIKALQEGSPAGLGFSYGVGGISRRVVLVPDDNIGGSGNYAHMTSEGLCVEGPTTIALWWKRLSKNLTTFCMTGYWPSSQISQKFLAGGDHEFQYDQDAGEGTGYFRGGAETDLPDIYYISTSFFSGEFTWISDWRNGVDSGNFALRVTSGGGTDENTGNVIIEKEFKQIPGLGSKMVFTVKLTDGTRLIFDEITANPFHSSNYINDKYQDDEEEPDCDDLRHCESQFAKVNTFESTTFQWHLTAVLPPGYHDGSQPEDNDPLNSEDGNKGTWMAFEYETLSGTQYYKYDEAQSGPSSSAKNVNGNSGTHFGGMADTPNPQPVRVCYLSAIRTPNEYALFNYPKSTNGKYDREDVFWYDNNYPPRDYASRTPEPRLDNIAFYSKDDVLRKKVQLEQSYTLRKNKFDAPQLYLYSLTLDALRMWDRFATSALPPVQFGYGYNPDIPLAYTQKWLPDSWGPTRIFGGTGPCVSYCKADYKDLWGYYYEGNGGNTSKNEWNADGVNNWYGGMSKAWSMKNISLPDGLEISWEYESGRYDRSNAQGVRVDSLGNVVSKFGGPPRVRKMNIVQAGNKKITRTFIYTDTKGVFVENDGNSSGYASVEPHNIYIKHDFRPFYCRGGHYTSVNAGYEMVQVIDNYIEPDASHPNGIAPYGYTVFRYTHNGDISDSDNFFPNRGNYGQIDNQWKRGLLVSKTVYNAKDKMISRDSIEYDFYDVYKQKSVNTFSQFDTKFGSEVACTFGRIMQKRKLTETGNVVQKSISCYSPELVATAPDDVTDDITPAFHYEHEVIQMWNETHQSILTEWPLERRGAFTTTKRLGNPDFRDYVIVIPETLGPTGTPCGAEKNASVFVRLDVQESYPEMVNDKGRWFQSSEDGGSGGICLPGFDQNNNTHNIIGVKVVNLDSSDPDNNDLMIIAASDCGNLGIDFYCIILPDFSVDASSGVFSWDGGNERVMLFRNHSYPVYTSCYNVLVSCAIGDINGNGKPDIALLEGNCIQDGTSEVPRRIFGYMDIDMTTSPDPNNGYSCCVSSLFYQGTALRGDKISFVDYDNDNNFNDLEITGQNPPYGSPTGYEANYPVHSTILKNVTMDMSNTNGTKPMTFSPSTQIVEDDYMQLGSWNASVNNYYSLGMVQVEDDQRNHRTQKVFAYLYPWFTPLLRLIRVYSGPALSDYDGVVNRSYTRNSDSSYLVTQNIPAHYHYDMDDLAYNIISRQCGGITYAFPPGTQENELKENLDIHFDKVVSAKATTWGEFNDVWLPKANYVWRMDMDTNGLPVSNFTEFNHDTIENNDPAIWQLTDSISRYNDNGRAVEVAKPTQSGGRLFSSVILGKDGQLQSGAVTRARFEECGVFTGDYQCAEEPTIWWDKANGWEKGGTNPPSLDSDSIHFGQKAIKVEKDFAAARNFLVEPGKSYTMTAWVKVTDDSGHIRMDGDFRYLINADAEWPLDWQTDLSPFNSSLPDIEEATPLSKDSCDGSWRLMTMEIPAGLTRSLDASKTWYCRAWVGDDPGNSANPTFTAYIDDIRFAPSNALMTSTYYDQVFQQPIISVDANNHPGRRVTYDGFGRPVKWEKLDPVTTATIPVQKKWYRLRNELPEGDTIAVLSPDGGESFTTGDKITIRWVNAGTEDITLWYRGGSGTWNPIVPPDPADLQAKSGWCSYDWIIPSGATGDCYVKAQIVGGAEDESDQAFTVATP